MAGHRCRNWLAFATWIVVVIANFAAQGVPAVAQRPPNILLIVADDLGFSDLGSFGGEILTPNLDALAMSGIRLTGFYTSPACSPTRAMLLTGSDSHLVGLGSMSELLTPEQRGRSGYEGYLNQRAATLAERLKMIGYETMISGKWHLGTNRGTLPSDRGFNKSFALLQGDHNHFGYDQAPEYKKYAAARDYRLNGESIDFPVGLYSDDYFTTRLLAFLEEPRANRPFFAYLSFTGPHWPLQAPPEDVVRYRHKYDAGPAEVRNARLAKLKRLGVIGDRIDAYPVDIQIWNEMAAEERSFEARKMEVYAAMVDRIDQNVGRVIRHLRDVGELDNTIIIFLSDNGPDGFSLQKPFDVSDQAIQAGISFDNRLENIGAASSYLSLGRIWAQVSATPFRGMKMEMGEGGIRTPAIVSGPGIRSGELEGTVLHVTDIVPTVLEFAQAPAEIFFNGRVVLAPQGRSWVKLLTGRIEVRALESDSHAWELVYRRAVRKGTWKATFQPSLIPLFKELTPLEKVQWQLFDIQKDPGEILDLSAEHPNVLNGMIDEWNSYAARNHIILPGGTVARSPQR